MSDTIANPPTAKRPRKMAREPKLATNEAPLLSGRDALASATGVSDREKPQTKSALVVDLLRRPEGATLVQLVEATGWLPHTTRAALTDLRKKDHVILKNKVNGATRYTIAGVTSK